MRDIIAKAQAGDNDSLAFLIKKYTPLIEKHARSYHLKNYDYDDLMQEGNLAVIKAINKFDNYREKNSFDSYAINSIRNAFKTLARDNIRYKDESSLNVPIDEGLEIIDLIEDTNIHMEAFIMNKITHTKLQALLLQLSPEEKDLIKEIYLNHKGSLRKYCLKRNITLYYGKKVLNELLYKLKSQIY